MSQSSRTIMHRSDWHVEFLAHFSHVRLVSYSTIKDKKKTELCWWMSFKILYCAKWAKVWQFASDQREVSIADGPKWQMYLRPSQDDFIGNLNSCLEVVRFALLKQANYSFDICLVNFLFSSPHFDCANASTFTWESVENFTVSGSQMLLFSAILTYQFLHGRFLCERKTNR